MNELLEKDEIEIKNMIYEIRGQQVMLDSDLAKLYQCANGTKSINLAVNRNKDRFPNDFYFQLTKDEYLNLKFQNETSNNHGGVRKLPYVFTEHGVAMLSSVLKTSVASEVSINIMRAFVSMRHYISDNLLGQRYINNMVLKHDNEIKLLQDTFKQFKPKNSHIFFEDQVYDAYSLLVDVLNKSNNEIVIIDNYIDKKLLDILSKVNNKVILITSKINDIDLEKYKEEYNNLEIIINKSFHDRFIILDNNILYHCGASFKDLGKKCFGINKIEEVDVVEKMLKKVDDVINEWIIRKRKK